MKKYITRFAAVSFAITAASLLIYVAAIYSRAFADLVNSTASVAVRFVLASITYILPFSFFELLIILSPLILIFTVTIAVRRADGFASMLRGATSLFAVVALIFTSYIFTLGIGYRTPSLSDKTGITEDTDVTADEIYSTVLAIVAELNALADSGPLTDGETHMPYSADEMSAKLIHAYDLMNEEYALLTNYKSRVKPVYFSTVMSDLGISGIYSFFTGEANVNVEYPDYCLPFTAAHELAHQRGICRENEANFVAFLVCIASDDEYIRYSGYLNMYEYLASALYRADHEKYYEVYSRISDVAKADMRAASAVYVKHKDSILGKINERLNDAYLKANGTEGVVSYGYVVRLAVGYYKQQNNR